MPSNHIHTEKAIQSLAKLLSFVLHPVFSPFLGIIIILYHPSISLFEISPNQKILLLSLVFLNTALLPSLFSYFLLRFGLISSIEMISGNERKWPYLITLIFYILTYILLLEARLPQIVYQLILGGVISILLISIINLKWKISAHMSGMGGISALCLCTSIAAGHHGAWLGVSCLLVSGLIGSVRLYLGAHNLEQVLAGWGLGFISICIFSI